MSYLNIENYERRQAGVEACLKANGFKNLEECRDLCAKYGIDAYNIVFETQKICFEDAKWAYVLGCAIALKRGVKSAEDAAKAIGEGLQAFCVPGSVAANRNVGIGHGNLGGMLLNDSVTCFAFLAGHESFAAAEGAIKIALNANKARKVPLKVILNGLGKDAAYIISRINGFTYVQTEYDFGTEEVKIVKETRFSDGPRGEIRCYGTNDVGEGVAIMKMEKVGVSITGNSTNPTRFQHPTAGIYHKWTYENNVPYFSVASGGGTGRTLHPDNMAAGPASYGMTDTMGRMHGDAQFAGSSSVPAHVEMMGFIGMGNNPMVGATVACAVAVYQALSK
ncbi:MAG: GGGtGRT protein [Bacilli bacterium]|nr:GGGtGRT protein [Bacilli bacterium]